MPSQYQIFSYYTLTGGAGILLLTLILWGWRRWARPYGGVDPFNRPIHALTALPFFYLLIALGFMFDSWWHITVGRDTFWIPPHLVILSGVVIIAIIGARLVARASGQERFFTGSILLFAAMFLVGMAFDDTIHRLFGEENIQTALVFLAPPHLFMAAALILLGFAIAAALIRVKPDQHSRTESFLLLALTFGAMLTFVGFLNVVFWPFVAYEALGRAGAFLAPFLIGFTLAMAFWYLPAVLPRALLLSLIMTSLLQLQMLTTHNPAVPVHRLATPPLPPLLLPVSLLAAAVALDIFQRYRPGDTVRGGALYGAVQGAVFYPLAALWFAASGFGTALTLAGAGALVALSAIGAGAGVLLAGRLQRQWQKAA